MEIIELLADGQFHSGDELGSALGVSRAAVWKQVQKLQEKGIEIFSVKGKGYKLSAPLELLSADLIQSNISSDANSLLKEIDVQGVVSSTNDIAMGKAADGIGSGYVCFAEQQTAGRGRRGRTWVSPFGANIYLSIVWDFYNGAAALEGLSLATGIAVADALRGVGCDAVELKWPNDLLIGGSKLGGILLEMTGDPAGHCQVVVGLGVNTRIGSADASAITQSFTQLSDQGLQISRNVLAGRLLSSILVMLNDFSKSGFHLYQAKWESLDAFRDKQVCLHAGEQKTFGIARGVDETGGLKLETEAGVQVYKGGELSLRLS